MSKTGKNPKDDAEPGLRRGPKPERLKIAGNWEIAVGKALKKSPPKGAKKATETPKKRGK